MQKIIDRTEKEDVNTDQTISSGEAEEQPAGIAPTAEQHLLITDQKRRIQ